jgi:aspartyl-tRNA synthetase
MFTHQCGKLTREDIGKEVTLAGWVNSARDHGGLLFVDVRDRSGVTQVVFDPKNKDLYKTAQALRDEFVIRVRGKVRQRPAGTENPNIPTGTVELEPKELTVLNESKPLPFQVSTNAYVSEDLRLKYRYIDLRRKSSVENLTVRNNVCLTLRNFLDKKGFLDIETPILTKSTPEGARDYIVPSRLNPGNFYALPQSPQLFKQILMVAGLERYYQIARCFRDEDLRSDRQPEFTQLDLELSFVDEEYIFSLIEELMKEIFLHVGHTLATPFPRMTYAEAIDKFGIDKPDLRYPIEFKDITALTKGCGFKVFEEAHTQPDVVIKGFVFPAGKTLSNSEINNFIQFAKDKGAKGLVWFQCLNGALTSNVSKFFSAAALEAIKGALAPKEQEYAFLVMDKKKIAHQVLCELQKKVIADFAVPAQKKFAFLWVTDFPLFQWSEEESRLVSEHHPFTAPREEDIPLIAREPLKVRSRSYDIVLNGVELGSGSIRIHSPQLQKKIFNAIGISEEEATKRFGFLIEALSYGAPPHGGFAFGLDRAVAMMCEAESIREVIAFPKTQKAFCPLTGAPGEVDNAQLKELHIKVADAQKQ